jgi:hypothetical protein
MMELLGNAMVNSVYRTRDNARANADNRRYNALVHKYNELLRQKNEAEERAFNDYSSLVDEYNALRELGAEWESKARRRYAKNAHLQAENNTLQSQRIRGITMFLARATNVQDFYKMLAHVESIFNRCEERVYEGTLKKIGLSSEDRAKNKFSRRLSQDDMVRIYREFRNKTK